MGGEITIGSGGGRVPLTVDRLEWELCQYGGGSLGPRRARELYDAIEQSGVEHLDEESLLALVGLSVNGPPSETVVQQVADVDTFGEWEPMDQPDAPKLPSVDLDISRLLAEAAAHVSANMADYPEVEERYEEFREGLVEARQARELPGETPDEAEKAVDDRLGEWKQRLNRRDPGEEVMVRVERAGQLAGQAMVATERPAAEFAEYTGDDPTDVPEYGGPVHQLRVSINRIYCREETPYWTSDDIIWRGKYTYEHEVDEPLKTYEYDFDTGDLWPTDEEIEEDRYDDPENFKLARVNLVPGKKSLFWSTNLFLEDDLLEPEWAERIENLSIGLIKLIVWVGLKMLESAANDEIRKAVNESDIPSEVGDALSEAAEEAIEAASEELRRKISTELDWIIKGGLGPELLLPFPFGTHVVVDWSNTNEPPIWQPFLDGLPQSGKKEGEDGVTSRRFRLQQGEIDENGRKYIDLDGGDYDVRVHFQVVT